MSFLHAVTSRVRVFLGLDWLEEARDIAEAARRQREEDEARANREPHDFARWIQDPKEYRRPAQNGGHNDAQ